MGRAVEYHQEIIPVNPQMIQDVCTAAGKDGWKLCSMLPITIQPLVKIAIQSQPPQTAVLLQFHRPVGWTQGRDELPAEVTEMADLEQMVAGG